MNWKEQFERRFWTPLGQLSEEYRLAVLHDMETAISAEIIEKLIEEIPTNIISGDEYEQGRMDEIKQHLRDKWL
jgi:hypothetical protein